MSAATKRVAAIDCGRTPSAEASALAVAAPCLPTMASADSCDGVRSSSCATSRIRRRSLLNTTRRSRAARAAEPETRPDGAGGLLIHAATVDPSGETVQFRLDSFT